MSVLFLAKEGFLEEPRFKILLNDETGSRHRPSDHPLASRAPLPYSLLLGKLNNTKATFLPSFSSTQAYSPSASPHFSHLKLLGKNPPICLYLCLFYQNTSCEMQSFNNGKWSFGGLQSIKIYVGRCTDTKILSPFDSYSKEMKYLISKKFRKCKPGFPFPTFSGIN